MKKFQLLLCASLLLGATVATNAQEKNAGARNYWFIQGQIGAAHTVGEAKFSDLISPAAALNIGYKFAPAFGARIGVSGWQAKGGWVTPKLNYQYKYVQGNIDVLADLSTLLCGFNPERVFNGYLFAGVGLNHSFDNDEANALDTRNYPLENLWQGGKTFVAGRFGLGCDVRLNDRLAINIEANTNPLSDKFNSKKADNCDWQFNALVGLSIKLGKSGKPAPVYTEPEAPFVAAQPEPVRETERQVQPQTEKTETAAVEPMTQNIFFALNSALVQDDQQAKITALATYLEKCPKAKVRVTGYADADTGNAKINKRLSESRARNVAEALKQKGISADRITVESKGDTEQPYSTASENRVSICVAE